MTKNKRFTVKKFIEDSKSHIIDNEGKIETLAEYTEYLNNLTNKHNDLLRSIDNICQNSTNTTTSTEIIVNLQCLLFNDFSNIENDSNNSRNDI